MSVEVLEDNTQGFSERFNNVVSGENGNTVIVAGIVVVAVAAIGYLGKKLLSKKSKDVIVAVVETEEVKSEINKTFKQDEPSPIDMKKEKELWTIAYGHMKPKALEKEKVRIENLLAENPSDKLLKANLVFLTRLIINKKKED